MDAFNRRVGEWQAKCLHPNARGLLKESPNPSLEPRLWETFLEESLASLINILNLWLPAAGRVRGGQPSAPSQQVLGQASYILAYEES